MKSAHNKTLIPSFRTTVACGVYLDGSRVPGVFTYRTAFEWVNTHKKGFVWLGLQEPNEHQMQSIAEVYNLHELIVEDAVSAHQRPKLERYDDTLVLSLRTVRYTGQNVADSSHHLVETGEIMIIVGSNFVITVRHGNHAGLSRVRAQLESDPDVLTYGPTGVLHAVADNVVDNYLAVTNHIENDVDEIEDRVFEPKQLIEIEEIYHIKREVLELRHVIAPLATPLHQLATGFGDLIPEGIGSYFRDVEDHHLRISSEVQNFDDVLTSLVDAAVAKVSVQQNTDMRKISAWVAIAAVPTMVAGIYGMNFDNMPELHTSYGYYVVVIVMILSCFALFVHFRNNRWL